MHKFIALVCLSLLVACGSATPPATPATEDVVNEATASPVPTVTPTPQPTAIPDVLASVPVEISPDDLSIIGGNFQFQIIEGLGYTRIGRTSAPADRIFLVLRGYLYNYSNSAREFHDVDFQIDFGRTRDLNPNVSLMAALARSVYTQAYYPDCNIVGCLNFVLPAKRAREVIVVYQVPAQLDQFTLNFSPGGMRPRQRLSLLLLTPREIDDERVTYTVVKESVNGTPAYTLSHSVAGSTDAEISEVIDSESLTVDNCFGTEPISREISITTNEISRFEVTEEIRGSVIGIGPIPFLSGLFEGYARRVHNKVEERELTITRTEQVTAAPGTRTGWRLETYKVSFTGLMIFTVGTRVLEVPYKLSNRLRTELVSVPATPCSGATATATP